MADRINKRVSGESSKPSKRRQPQASSHTPIAPADVPQNPTPVLQRIRPAFQVPAIPAPDKQPSTVPARHASKVAIPRLRRESDVSAGGSSLTGDKNRVTHACEPCRQRKTKCSGEIPTCKHCEDFKLTCVYADGKRDKVKRKLGDMSQKVGEYEQVLRDLCSRVSLSDQVLIQKALDKEPVDDDSDVASSFRTHRRTGGEPDGETQVSAGVGSTGSLDCVNEDFNREEATRATGYMGKNSEVTWMQRLMRQTHRGGEHAIAGSVNVGSTDRKEKGIFHGNPVASESTYHEDDLSILLPDQVDQYEMPPTRVAELLFHHYLNSVHHSFPIIAKNHFGSQFNAYITGHSTGRPNNHWLAILNMIFAISAKYAHLIRAEWRGDERDHLIYFTRARMLGFNGDTVLDHPDLQQVQITGLMSFYLLATNQINRAWTISGVAIRYGVTLGLNLNNVTAGLADTLKEIRYRVWWSLYSVERMLAVMTGRPTSISDSDCNITLPLPIDEDSFPTEGSKSMYPQALRRFPSSNSGPGSGRGSGHGSRQGSRSTEASPPSNYSSRINTGPNSAVSPDSASDRYRPTGPSMSLYFYDYTQLSVITHGVVRKLYRASTMTYSWAEIQEAIRSLDDELETWRSNLLDSFDFTKKQRDQRDQQFVQARMTLGFSYYATRIIIYRPCLCKFDRIIPNQTDKSKEFNKHAAASCVRAAKDMINMLPNYPDPVRFYQVGPWWCAVHHLMQAATVLMLEMSFRTDHMPEEVEEIINAAKKATIWLNAMAEESIAARRGWKLCNGMLRLLAPKIGKNVDDLPTTVVGEDDLDGIGRGVQDNPQFTNFNTGMDGPNQHTVPPYSDQYYYGAPALEQPTPFQPAMFTNFDEYFPPDGLMNPIFQTTAPPMGTMFPTTNQMGFLPTQDAGVTNPPPNLQLPPPNMQNPHPNPFDHYWDPHDQP